MATNPYVNKVLYGNQTVMDLTEDTVTPNDVLRGVTFHDKSGALQTGNLVTHNVIDNLNSDSSEDALSARMGKKVNVSSNQKVIDAVGWDGRNYFHVDDTVVSGTDNGITYTITRKNGEVTRIRCNGTPTSGDFTLWLGSWTYGGTSPILTGCPSGGGSQGTIVNYGMSAAENGGYQYVVTAGDEPAKLYEYFYSGSISISIIIKSGYTASNLDFYPMICSEELSDYDFKAHHDSVETLLGKKQNILTFDNTPTAGSNNPVKSSGIKTAIDTSASNVQSADIDLLKDTVGWTGKNLANLSSVNTQTVNDVTYTINKNQDGQVDVIDVNGTASGGSPSKVMPLKLKAGSYILNGCPASGSNSTYRIDLKNADGTAWSSAGTIIDTGNGVSFTLANDESVSICIRIENGFAASHLKFYPMIRKAEVTDATFEPYHPSVEECKFDRAEQRVLGAKNLLKYPYYHSNRTSASVTYTDNGDGSITVNGTATGDNSSYVFWDKSQGFPDELKNIPLIITGGLSSDCRLQLWKTGGVVAKDEGNGATFVIDDSVLNATNWSIAIFVPENKTVSNVTIKPMLRLASDPDNTYVPYAMTNKELTDSRDVWAATASVSNGSVTFTGIDDTGNNAYEVYFNITSSSSEKNPTAELTSISGEGTSSMTLTYSTNADNGTNNAKLRRIV